MLMSGDGNDGDVEMESEEEDITIPALFVTMAEGDALVELISSAEGNTNAATLSTEFISVVPYSRWYPEFHYTSIALWALAVLAAFVSSYLSAKEYRNSWTAISAALEEGILVFQMTRLRRRRRANTADTVDLAEEGEEDLEGGGEEIGGDDGLGDLALQVEMTEMNGNGGSGGTLVNMPAVGNTEGGGGVENGDSPSTSPINVETGDSTSPSPATENRTPDSSEPPVQTTTLTTTTASNGSPEAPMTNEEPPTTTRTPPPPPRSSAQPPPEHLELKAWHALMFVTAASGILFLLFFFHLYNVVRVMYGLGGSVAMSQILFMPLYDALAKKAGIGKGFHRNVAGNCYGCRGVYWKFSDLISLASGYSIGLAWLYVGFSRVDPMATAYYWVVMDIMGVCFCILILGILRINTIMVATVLLSVVFFYDVFYVFITPYIFGSSVMIEVATGGGQRDYEHCEKYPTDSGCPGSMAPLPMLLAMPWEADYRGGHSLIGLGDIVLPGLLLSFAARLDAAKALVKKCTAAAARARGGDGSSANGAVGSVSNGGATPAEGGDTTESFVHHRYHLGRIYHAIFQGYFGPLVIAYAIGLLAAYFAVWFTRLGQPALLYLVPSCLGTVFFLGWRRNEVKDLWNGPPMMKKADKIIASASRIPRVRSAVTRANVSSDLAETRSIA